MQHPLPPKQRNAAKEKLIEPTKFQPITKPIRKYEPRLQIKNVLVVFGLLASAIVAWYIVTGKSVYIETTPDTAKLTISGGIKLKLADRFLLRQQSYQVHLTAEGYHSLQQELKILNESNQQYYLQMDPLPGHLKINTQPTTNAQIWIDDTAFGQTPSRISGLEPGNYNIKITSERFFDYESELEIEGLDREQLLTADLVPAWANIDMSSSPPGANIFVDDVLVGITPFSAELLQGEHDLRIKLPRHKLFRKVIRVIANEDQDIKGIILEPADATVQITTVPDKANITINGEYIGQSPVEAAFSPDIETKVNAFKPGFTRASKTVKLSSGENSSLRIDLKPETTPVLITSEPNDAQLYIDGSLRGLANQTIDLTTTPHTIEIRKKEYVEYKIEITPRPGIDQHINIQLKTLRQARTESIKPEIQTITGQILRMFKPTSIIMGASRREPGRRANETIRNVQFSRSFYLSKTEVSNAEYQNFDPNHNSGEVMGNKLNGDTLPVVNITWEQAALYCNWLSEQESLTPFYSVIDNKITSFNPSANGYRLPTEAEWEWAAREQASKQLKYPWGNEFPPEPMSGNYADITAASIIGNIIRNYNDNQIISSPVASFTPNSKGLYDLGGNVAEWVHDFYDISISDEKSILDPVGPNKGEHHVIKGSSWAHGTITELRLSFRDYGSEKRSDVGFRIARYIE